MRSTQIAALSDEELIERTQASMVGITALTLGERLEERNEQLAKYEAIGTVEQIVAALELAREASLWFSTNAELVRDDIEERIDAALEPLKF